MTLTGYCKRYKNYNVYIYKDIEYYITHLLELHGFETIFSIFVACIYKFRK
jgi:hypothetical protein